MQSLRSLARLDLQGNQLHSLPVELLSLLALNTLNISRNCVGPRLTFDPARACPSLRHLNLSFNKIAAFPHELSHAGSQLEELCLEGWVWGWSRGCDGGEERAGGFLPTSHGDNETLLC